MKLLANENFPLSSARLLAEAGHDIIHIGEHDPSIADELVIKLAIAQHRLILTVNGKSMSKP